MNVLVDTPVLSLVLRRTAPDPSLTAGFDELVVTGRLRVIGPVRQEILSGIRDELLFASVEKKLAAFSDLPIAQGDYVEAARCFNICRARGVQGSHTDFLICAVAMRHKLSIFTTDQDFLHYRTCLPIHLHAP